MDGKGERWFAYGASSSAGMKLVFGHGMIPIFLLFANVLS